MHGKYKCSVKTDLGSHESEQDLIVISQSNCKLNDWRIKSEPNDCRESFKLDCKNMFPKPVPSCGLWNGKSDKFIRSVSVDISEEQPNGLITSGSNLSTTNRQPPQRQQTYRIRYLDKFEFNKTRPTLEGSSPGQEANKSIEAQRGTNMVYGLMPAANSDLLQYAGHLIFKCDIVVPDTSWKLSLSHRMFDFNDGCYLDPLETVEKIRQNYTQSVTARMQKAGYSMEKQQDEMEMLSSQLTYELLPPLSTNGRYSRQLESSRHDRIDLNCWQKPKFGTIAKLSCTNESGINKPKFTGANLLECRSNGWVLLADSLESDKPRNPIKGPRTSRKVDPTRLSKTSDAKPDLGDEGLKNIEKINELDDNNFSAEKSDENDDLEAPKVPSLHEVDTKTIPALSTDDQDLVLEVDVSLPISELISTQQPLSSLELAHLLPTCVSTRRLPKEGSHNRLAFKDGHVLESKHQNRLSNRKSSANVGSSAKSSILQSAILSPPFLAILMTNIIGIFLVNTQLHQLVRGDRLCL